MFERLEEVESKYERVLDELQSPGVASDPNRLRDLGKQQAELAELVRPYRDWKKAQSEVASARQMLQTESDPEMRALV